MKIGTSGGGFFYKPFSQTLAMDSITMFPGAIPNTFGAWVNFGLLNSRSIQARWFQIDIYTQDFGDPAVNYGIQVGIGDVGIEQVIIPTNGGVIRYAFHHLLPHSPYSISFPFNFPANQLVSLRANANIATISSVQASIYFWN